MSKIETKNLIQIWSIVLMLHVAGSKLELNLFWIIIMGIATICAWYPHPIIRWGFVCAGFTSFLYEYPRISNHWVFMGILFLLVLISWYKTDGIPEKTIRFLRIAVYLLYGFAVLHKINAGFFSLESCVKYFGDMQFRTLGLEWEYGMFLIGITAVLTLLIEALIPFLLWYKPKWGAILLVAFHGFLTINAYHHFYDFTSVMFATIPFFLRWKQPKNIRWQLATIPVLIGWVATPWVDFLAISAWITWGILLICIALFCYKNEVEERILSTPFQWSIQSVVQAIVIGLMILNGLAPYLGLKDKSAFNMYSNLYTIKGDSNHFFLPSFYWGIPEYTVAPFDDTLEYPHFDRLIQSPENPGLPFRIANKWILFKWNDLDHPARCR